MMENKKTTGGEWKMRNEDRMEVRCGKKETEMDKRGHVYDRQMCCVEVGLL